MLCVFGSFLRSCCRQVNHPRNANRLLSSSTNVEPTSSFKSPSPYAPPAIRLRRFPPTPTAGTLASSHTFLRARSSSARTGMNRCDRGPSASQDAPRAFLPGEEQDAPIFRSTHPRTSRGPIPLSSYCCRTDAACGPCECRCPCGLGAFMRRVPLSGMPGLMSPSIVQSKLSTSCWTWAIVSHLVVSDWTIPPLHRSSWR